MSERPPSINTSFDREEDFGLVIQEGEPQDPPIESDDDDTTTTDQE